MLKLYSGAFIPGAFTALKCDAAYNWQHYGLLHPIASGGGEVWPMLCRADHGGHLARLDQWPYPVRRLMILNEPFDTSQDGFKTPEEAAEWASMALTLSGFVAGPSIPIILGGFNFTYPTCYGDIRPRVMAFARAFGGGENIIYAFHPYLPEVPGNVPAALLWFADQIEAIRDDFPRYAITEWGVLRSGYSRRERDIVALSQYMRGGWEVMAERNCYASAWYLATPNRFTGAADFVLTSSSGIPSPLGMVYRDLPPVEPSPPQPSPQPDAIAILEELVAELGALIVYAQYHPHVGNADLLVRLRDILKRKQEEVDK